jgi:hypothetical protein
MPILKKCDAYNEKTKHKNRGRKITAVIVAISSKKWYYEGVLKKLVVSW